MTAAAVILLAAFLLDLVCGDPRWRCHPVRLIGRLIAVLERLLRRMRRATVPGGAALTLTTWPEGEEKLIARADYHGRWVQWIGW